MLKANCYLKCLELPKRKQKIMLYFIYLISQNVGILSLTIQIYINVIADTNSPVIKILKANYYSHRCNLREIYRNQNIGRFSFTQSNKC